MVHERNEDLVCGPIMPQGGLQAAEVTFFNFVHVFNLYFPYFPLMNLNKRRAPNCHSAKFSIFQSCFQIWRLPTFSRRKKALHISPFIFLPRCQVMLYTLEKANQLVLKSIGIRLGGKLLLFSCFCLMCCQPSTSSLFLNSFAAKYIFIKNYISLFRNYISPNRNYFGRLRPGHLRASASDRIHPRFPKNNHYFFSEMLLKV